MTHQRSFAYVLCCPVRCVWRLRSLALTRSLGPFLVKQLTGTLTPVLHKILDKVLHKKLPPAIAGSVATRASRALQITLVRCSHVLVRVLDVRLVACSVGCFVRACLRAFTVLLNCRAVRACAGALAVSLDPARGSSDAGGHAGAQRCEQRGLRCLLLRAEAVPALPLLARGVSVLACVCNSTSIPHGFLESVPALLMGLAARSDSTLIVDPQLSWMSRACFSYHESCRRVCAERVLSDLLLDLLHGLLRRILHRYSTLAFVRLLSLFPCSRTSCCCSTLSEAPLRS